MFQARAACFSACLAAIALQACATPPFDAARADAMELSDGHGRLPFAVAWYRDAMFGHWTVLSFYSADGQGWIMRRAEGGGSNARSQGWAWSASCPAMGGIIEQMEKVPAPHIDAPSIGGSSGDVSPFYDGGEYGLRTKAIFLAAVASTEAPGGIAGHGALEMTSNAFTPLATWFDHASHTLAACWGAPPPEWAGR